MGYVKRFYGYNLSQARKLKKDMHCLFSNKRNKELNGQDCSGLVERINECRHELNVLLVKGEKFGEI